MMIVKRRCSVDEPEGWAGTGPAAGTLSEGRLRAAVFDDVTDML